MTSHKTQPPWEFLLSASRTSLQSYELSRLSHAANLRKKIAALLDQWIEENSCAMLARWLMDYREREVTLSEALPSGSARTEGGKTVSDNFFAEGTAVARANRGAS